MVGLLESLASKLSLSEKVSERAEEIYRKVAVSGLHRGKKSEGLIAGSLFIACRQEGVTRSLTEVAEASSLVEKEVCRAYRHILRNLDINFKPTDLKNCIQRLTEKIDLEDKVEEEAVKIAKKISQTSLVSGRNPFGVASAAVYIASCLHGRRRSQSEIGKAANVSDVTIRTRYKEIVDKLDIEKSELE